MNQDIQKINTKKTFLSRVIPCLMMYQEHIAQLICDSEVSKFKRYNKGLSDFIVKTNLYEGPQTGKIVGK